MRISDWSSDVCSSDLSLRRRHHYGTTGCRLHLDVRARLAGGGRLFERDHNVFPDATGSEVDEVMMGDIVQTGDDEVELTVEVAAPAPIERIEIRNGTEVVELFRPYGPEDLGARVREIGRASCRESVCTYL